MLDDEEQEASELERLCHVGAAELLMPLEEFSLIAAPDWSLRRAEELAAVFGASLEATVYRLATAYPGVAIAGSAFFRHTKGDQAKLDASASSSQSTLFTGLGGSIVPIVQPPKYRRQSLHFSETCPKKLIIPWNKSFDASSCIYRASNPQLVSSVETHPMDSTALGVMEAICSPYQRSSNSGGNQDVLFVWKAAA
jgi:hypothetical protein